LCDLLVVFPSYGVLGLECTNWVGRYGTETVFVAADLYHFLWCVVTVLALCRYTKLVLVALLSPRKCIMLSFAPSFSLLERERNPYTGVVVV